MDLWISWKPKVKFSLQRHFVCFTHCYQNLTLGFIPKSALLTYTDYLALCRSLCLWSVFGTSLQTWMGGQVLSFNGESKDRSVSGLHAGPPALLLPWEIEVSEWSYSLIWPTLKCNTLDSQLSWNNYLVYRCSSFHGIELNSEKNYIKYCRKPDKNYLKNFSLEYCYLPALLIFFYFERWPHLNTTTQASFIYYFSEDMTTSVCFQK